MSNRKTFQTALEINLEYDNSFIEGCFYFIYRREKIMFNSENQEDFINKLLYWSRYTKLMCFINHPKKDVEKNPLNYIIEFCDLKGLKYSIIATDEKFNQRFNKPYQIIKDKEEEKEQQITFNLNFEERKTKLNIIEVRLEKPYRLSFRNLDNITPVRNFSKEYYPHNSVFNQQNNDAEITTINQRENDLYATGIKRVTAYLYNEIEYYQKRFYYEENINILRDQFSLKDLYFMQYISKKKDTVWS